MSDEMPFFRLRALAQLLIIGLAATVAACGSSGSGNVGEFSIPPTCQPAAPVSLIYPAPNATSVPDAFSELVVATTASGINGLSTLRPVFIYSGTNTNSGFSLFEPLANASAIPTPYASPVFDGTPNYAVSFSRGGAFPSSQALQVFLGGSNCTVGLNIGTFTLGTPPPQAAGQLTFVPYGTTLMPTALASTSPTNPYAASQSTFQVTFSEQNYPGKFTASVAYFASPLTTPCYTVTMDGATGTIASFLPVAPPTGQGANLCVSAPVTVEGAFIEDQYGNSAIFYFKP